MILETVSWQKVVFEKEIAFIKYKDLAPMFRAHHCVSFFVNVHYFDDCAARGSTHAVLSRAASEMWVN